MRGAVLLVLLLTAAGLASAAEPHARPDLALDHPGLDVAVSGDGTHIITGVADEGSRVQAPRNQDTWSLYTVLSSGFNVRQEGDVDPAVCDNVGVLGDDCSTSAAAVAIDGSGTRYAAAGINDDGDTVVIFGTATQGEIAKHVMGGALIALSMSQDGTRIVAVADRSGLGNGGRIVTWTWNAASSTVQESWNHEFSGDPTAADVSADGQWTIIATGGTVRRYDPAGTARTDTTGSTVTSVAIAQNGDYTAIAGLQNGDYRVYSRLSGNNDRELNIPDSGIVGKVAIASDAGHIAIAQTQGNLKVVVLQAVPPVLQGDILLNADIGSAIDDMAFSHDGTVLLLRQGAKVQMRAVLPSMPVLWEDTLASTPAAMAMAGSGDAVAVVHGSAMRYYEADRDVRVTVPSSATLAAGQDHVVQVSVRNDGNRHETVDLAVTAPAGLTATVYPTQVLVLPGQTTTAALNISVPAETAPGSAAFEVTGTPASSDAQQATLTATIPEVEAWALSAQNKPTSLPVQPGQAVTFELTVRNEGNVPGEPPVSITTVGQGWTSQIVDGTQELEPGESATLKVRLNAPAAAPDLSQGKVRVMLPGKPFIELVATVGASFAVQIDAPDSVRLGAGQETTLNVEVRNTGNTVDRFVVSVSGPAGWTVAWGSDVTQLTTTDMAAGTTRQLALMIQSPTAASAVPQGVTIQATSLADSAASASKTVLVEPEIETGGDTTTSKPGPVPWWVLLGVVALAWMRRR